jgi:hypothetical protein
MSLSLFNADRPIVRLACPEAHRAIVQRVIDRMPPAYWRLPATGDVIAGGLDAFEAHIRAFSFCTGFDVVREGGGNTRAPSLRLQCIHHGTNTQNTRGLEDRVVRDDEGTIISQRKLDNTSVQQLGCTWKVRCTWKDQHRGRGDTAWIVNVVNSVHSHDLRPDPMTYIGHRQATDEYRAQAAVGRHHRTKVIPYSVSRRVLEDEDYGMLLTSKEYYNAVRAQPANKSEDKSIAGLIVTLQEAGFVYRTRVKVTYEGEVAVARKLVQLWFAHPTQLEMARRFVSGFALIIDGTFNTNSLRLPLLVAVGSLHTGASFPVFFSFCPSEDRASFEFCWDSFKEECLYKGEVAADPGVIIADWAPGLIAAHSQAWPNTSLQGCDWHAAQAMMKWFREKKYDHVFLEGEYVADSSGKKVHIEGLKSFIWRYIKSPNLPDLEVNRGELVNLLKAEHRGYILLHWKPLEPRFIHHYVSYLPNLGSTSSQKVESYHPVIRAFINAQLSLEKSVTALVKSIETWARTTGSEELASLRAYPRLCQGSADEAAFNYLKMKITIEAARKIEREWYEMTTILRANPQADLGPCRCIIHLAFGLPCRHLLQRVYDSGQSIPRSLVHPRWWLLNEQTHPIKWLPTYPNTLAISYHGGSDDILQRSLQIDQIRSLLAPEEASRFRAQELRVQNQLLGIAHTHLQLQTLPIGLPNANPRHPGRQRRSGRIETGPERVEREVATDRRQATATPPLLPIPIPTTITPPPKRAYLAIRTPERPPTPARGPPVAPTTAPISEEEVDTMEPPSSTAPAAMGRRSGRPNQGRGWDSLVPKARGRGKK